MMELGYSAMGPCICGISAFKQNDKTTAKYFNHWDWDQQGQPAYPSDREGDI